MVKEKAALDGARKCLQFPFTREAGCVVWDARCKFAALSNFVRRNYKLLYLTFIPVDDLINDYVGCCNYYLLGFVIY